MVDVRMGVSGTIGREAVPNGTRAPDRTADARRTRVGDGMPKATEARSA